MDSTYIFTHPKEGKYIFIMDLHASGDIIVERYNTWDQLVYTQRLLQGPARELLARVELRGFIEEK